MALEGHKHPIHNVAHEKNIRQAQTEGHSTKHLTGEVIHGRPRGASGHMVPGCPKAPGWDQGRNKGSGKSYRLLTVYRLEIIMTHQY